MESHFAASMTPFRKTHSILAGIVVLAASLAMGCGPESRSAGPKAIQAAAPASTGLDLAGQSVDPFRRTESKATVLVFVSADCPISNRYAPEIRRLRDQFVPQGVSWWLVYHDPELTAEAIRQHLREYQLPESVLRDPRHSLVKKAKVRVTPEAAVFGPDGRLVYHGRIDNRHVDFGQERPAATEHDLQETLAALLAGKPIPKETATAVGCYIPDSR